MSSRVLLAGAAALGALVSPVQGSDLGASSGERVYFRGWQYKPHIVQGNTDRYNSRHNGNVDYQTVTGDYPSLMEISLIAGDRLDMIYANPSTAVRFMEAGWILPADELPAADQAKADMYPNVREAWTHKGKLLGLSYFLTIRGLTTVYTKRLHALGLSAKDYPGNWDEFYDQIDQLTRRGVRDVYLPHWFNEYYGISYVTGSFARSFSFLTSSEVGPSKMQKHFASSGMNIERWYRTGVPSPVISVATSRARRAASRRSSAVKPGISRSTTNSGTIHLRS